MPYSPAKVARPRAIIAAFGGAPDAYGKHVVASSSPPATGESGEKETPEVHAVPVTFCLLELGRWGSVRNGGRLGNGPPPGDAPGPRCARSADE